MHFQLSHSASAISISQNLSQFCSKKTWTCENLSVFGITDKEEPPKKCLIRPSSIACRSDGDQKKTGFDQSRGGAGSNSTNETNKGTAGGATIFDPPLTPGRQPSLVAVKQMKRNTVKFLGLTNGCCQLAL
jgi:hypothetical protein